MNEVWQVGDTLEQAEEKIIKAALVFYGGNKSMTAQSLGVSLRGLDGKMQRFNIDKEKVIEDGKENTTTEAKQKNRRGRPKGTRKTVQREAISSAS